MFKKSLIFFDHLVVSNATPNWVCWHQLSLLSLTTEDVHRQVTLLTTIMKSLILCIVPIFNGRFDQTNSIVVYTQCSNQLSFPQYIRLYIYLHFHLNPCSLLTSLFVLVLVFVEALSSLIHSESTTPSSNFDKNWLRNSCDKLPPCVIKQHGFQ